MAKLPYVMTIVFILIYLIQTSTCASKKNKIAKRRMIIRCCGRKSCLFVKGKRNRNTTVKSDQKVINDLQASIDSLSSKKGVFSTKTIEIDPTVENTVEVSSDDEEPEQATSGASNEQTETTEGQNSMDSKDTSTAAALHEQSTTTEEAETTTTEMPSSTTTNLATTTSVAATSVTTTFVTTTTTIKPSCAAFCGNQSCLAEQVKMAQMLLGQDSSEGKYLKACGRKYFISSMKMTVNEAKKACCAYKMRLLTVASAAEHQCIASLNEVLKQTAISYWTSGFVDSVCKFWCTEKNISIGSDLNWLQKEATNPAEQNCIAFEMNVGDSTKSGLKFANCNEQNVFICETVEVSCPQTAPLAKNLSIYDADGDLQNPQQYGSWENGANATFLFGNSLVTWPDAWSQCEKLGMLPLSLISDIETNFVRNLFENWGYNFNYWTAGTRLDYSSSGPIWCQNRNEIVASANWPVNDITNKSLAGKSDCIAFQITKISSNVSVSYSGSFALRNCSQRQMLACKGPPTPKPCIRLTCPTKFSKNASHFNASTGELKDPTSVGSWKMKCDSFFIFGDAISNQSTQIAQLTWDEARQRCESIGFKLITFDSRSKFDCLLNVSQKNLAPFWTSGAYLDCKSGLKYAWCGINRFVNMGDMVWGQGQPPQLKTKTCISGVLKLDGGVHLEAVDCDSKLSYVCEAEDTKGESLAKAKNEECQRIFNVSDADLDTVFTNLNYTKNLKCYFKCMGESLDLVDFNGAVVGSEIIKLIQATIANFEEAEKNFDVFDVCKSNTGAGECETVAQSFKCTVEKSPDVVAKIVNNAVADVGSAPPVGCLKELCPFKLPNCTVDATKVSQVSSDIAPPGIAYFVVACGRKFAVSADWYDIPTSMKKCCEMGMTHASFSNYDDLKCFIDTDKALNKGKQGSQYSVAAYRAHCLPIYSWCPSQKPVDNSFKWSKGASYNPETHKCTYLPISTGFFVDTLVEMPCLVSQGKQQQYICMSN